jgi:hypothetical protein
MEKRGVEGEGLDVDLNVETPFAVGIARSTCGGPREEGADLGGVVQVHLG